QAAIDHVDPVALLREITDQCAGLMRVIMDNEGFHGAPSAWRLLSSKPTVARNYSFPLDAVDFRKVAAILTGEAQMAWWRKTKAEKEADRTETAAEKKSVARGVFAKCESCDEIVLADDLAENLRVCPKCDFHFTLPTTDRIAMVVDSGTWQEH